MSSDIGHRCVLDPALLWLWWRLATVALISPLTRELPSALGAAVKKKKKKKKKREREREREKKEKKKKKKKRMKKIEGAWVSHDFVESPNLSWTSCL